MRSTAINENKGRVLLCSSVGASDELLEFVFVLTVTLFVHIHALEKGFLSVMKVGGQDLITRLHLITRLQTRLRQRSPAVGALLIQPE